MRACKSSFASVLEESRYMLCEIPSATRRAVRKDPSTIFTPCPPLGPGSSIKDSPDAEQRDGLSMVNSPVCFTQSTEPRRHLEPSRKTAAGDDAEVVKVEKGRFFSQNVVKLAVIIKRARTKYMR
jgi:hypothetical protein